MKAAILILACGLVIYWGVKGIMFLAHVGDTKNTPPPVSHLHGED